MNQRRFQVSITFRSVLYSRTYIRAVAAEAARAFMKEVFPTETENGPGVLFPGRPVHGLAQPMAEYQFVSTLRGGPIITVKEIEMEDVVTEYSKTPHNRRNKHDSRSKARRKQ